MEVTQEDIQHSEALISLEETRAREEELQLGKLMLVSNCRFSGDDIEQLQMFVDRAPLSRADVQRLRKEAVVGPKATPPAVLHAMSRIDVSSAETPTAPPSWLRDVCSCRDSLRGSAIGFESAAGTDWYLFVYASQSPYAASFVRI